MLKFYFLLIFLCMFVSGSSYERELSQTLTRLDDNWFRPIFRTIRTYVSNLVGSTGLRKNGKWRQKSFPDSQKFPCDLKWARSVKVPDSVHKLRPGDIDIISAMGDSVTAGTGAASTRFLDIAIENRGLSWSGGGQWNWRNTTTLANILKEFNSNLIGYSVNDSLPFERGAQFNVAEIGAVTSDLPYMAKILVKRIKSDQRVDYRNHWKMVTILIGGNDFCSFICTLKNPREFPKIYKKKLMETLTYLKQNLPRSFVNIVPLIPLERVVLTSERPQHCKTIHIGECSCWLGHLYNQTNEKRKLYRHLQRETWKVESDIAKEFRGLKEFTVVYQPFTTKAKIMNKAGFSMFAWDCFHLSQKGHAYAATGLWNNLLEQYGNKTTSFAIPQERFLCPTKEHPYLFTYDNSDCSKNKCNSDF